jgi:hypothetical protein
MKKFIIAVCSFVVLGTGTAFAGDETNPNTIVKEAFGKDYANATAIQFESFDDFTKVSFTLGDQRLYAFYDNDGDRIGTAHYVHRSRLPFAIAHKLETAYKDYNVNDEVIEFSTAYGTHYYIKVYNTKKQLMLKSDTDGALHVVKKQKG